MNETPGEALKEELENRGVTVAEAARAMGVPHNRIARLISGKHGLSLDMAYRIAFYLNESMHPWFLKQAHHDIQEYEKLYVADVRSQVIPWDRVN